LKSNFKSVHFYDETYAQNILFCVGTQKDTQKYVKRNYNLDLDFKGNEGGKCFEVRGYGIIIWMPMFKKEAQYLGVLAHEITHAVVFVFDVVSIKVDADNSEPMAYLMESYTRRFLQEWNKL